MKALVIYDSLYGNTRLIAQAISEAIPGEVELVHVGDVKLSELGDYDLLVVGGPTQGAQPSPPVKELLDKIPANARYLMPKQALIILVSYEWLRGNLPIWLGSIGLSFQVIPCSISKKYGAS